MNLRILKAMVLVMVLGLLTAFGDEDKITWGSRTIQWTDYRGKGERTNSVARTYYDVELQVDKVNKDSMVAQVAAVFFPERSWSVMRDDELLLEHERGHFDIAEVYARKIRERIVKERAEGMSEKDVRKIHQALMEELNTAQDLYDKETNSSTNKPGQKKWSAKIKRDLKMLDKYSSTAVGFHK